jgi:putative oxidoreductase
MKNPLSPSTSTSLGLLLARLPVGLVFLIAGFNKIKGGVGEFVSKQLHSATGFMPEPLAKAFLGTLPFMELLVGITLLLGLFGRISGLVASLLLISFMIAVTGLKSTGGLAFHYNVVLLGVTLLIALAGAGDCSLDALMRKRRTAPPKQA